MWERLQHIWIPTLLFLVTLFCALILAGLVLISPWITASGEPVWTLFAADRTVRRTSLFSAAGLVVTAFAFFRPKTRGPSKRKPPPPMVGA